MQDLNEMKVPHYKSTHLQGPTTWSKRVKIIEENFTIGPEARRFYKNIPNENTKSRHEYYKYCISQVNTELNIWASLGVHEGKRERKIIEYKNKYFPHLQEKHLHGFDSFQGLPSYWKPGFPKGKFNMENVPTIAGCKLHIGWFSETLPVFASENKGKTLALLHVDCDLYSSTVDIFENLANMVVPGTIIMFDEIQGEEVHIEHEKKAFDEFVDKYKVEYEWLAWMANASQATCVIKSINNLKGENK